MNHTTFTQLVFDFLADKPGAAEAFAVNVGQAIWNRALALGLPKSEALVLCLRCLTALMQALKDGEHLRSGRPLEVWFRVQVRALLVAYWTEETLLGRPLEAALRLHHAVAATLATLPPLQRQVLMLRPDGSVATYAALAQGLGLRAWVVRQAHEQGLATLRHQLAAHPELRPVLARLTFPGQPVKSTPAPLDL